MSWKEIKIGDLGKIITGNTPPKKILEYYGKDYKFIKPTDMELGMRYTHITEEYYSNEGFKKYESSLIPPLSTCVVTIGSIGKKMTLTDDYCFINQAVNAVIPNQNKYDPYFVYYALKNILHKVKSADTGASSGRENVSKTNFSRLSIFVPESKVTQQKIASILSAYDDLIENNLKRIKLLEEAAQNIYKEWFVHFRFPGYEDAVFENGLPKGWVKRKTDSVFRIVKGKKPINEFDKPTPNSQLYLLVDVLERQMLRYTEDQKLPQSEFGEVIMLMDGSRSGCVFKGMKGAIGSTLAVFKLIDDSINIEYAYQYFKSKESEIRSKNTGAAIPHASKGYIAGLEILIPDFNAINYFGSRISAINSFIENLYTQNQFLKESRDILLPRLMNRTIEV